MTKDRLVPVRRKVTGQLLEFRQEGDGKSVKGMYLERTARVVMVGTLRAGGQGTGFFYLRNQRRTFCPLITHVL